MNHKEQYTVIPLRDVVVFPYMIVPIFVGRPRSVKALNIANSTDKKLFLTLQKEAVTDNPQIEDLNETGIIARVLQTMQLPDGNVKVLIEGLRRAKMNNLVLDEECYFADVEWLLEDEANVEETVEPVLEIEEPLVQPEKSHPKFKNSEFISPIFGKDNNNDKFLKDLKDFRNNL